MIEILVKNHNFGRRLFWDNYFGGYFGRTGAKTGVTWLMKKKCESGAPVLHLDFVYFKTGVSGTVFLFL